MRSCNCFGAAWFEYQRDRARYLAVAMIYYALVSLIPLLLLLLAALGLLLRFSITAAEVQQQLLLNIEAYLGTQMRETVKTFLDSLEQESQRQPQRIRRDRRATRRHVVDQYSQPDVVLRRRVMQDVRHSERPRPRI